MTDEVATRLPLATIGYLDRPVFGFARKVAQNRRLGEIGSQW